MPSLYLTYEQSLRMKKWLSRLEGMLAEGLPGELGLRLAAAELSMLARGLSPLSRSRRLLEEVAEAGRTSESARRSADKIRAAARELCSLYEGGPPTDASSP